MKKLIIIFLITLINCNNFNKNIITNSDENINTFYAQLDKLIIFENLYLKNKLIKIEEINDLFNYSKKEIINYNQDISIYILSSKGIISSDIKVTIFNKEVIEAQFSFYLTCRQYKRIENCNEMERKFYSFSKLFNVKIPERLYFEYYDKSKTRDSIYKVNPNNFSMVKSKYSLLLKENKDEETIIGSFCGIGGSEPEERSLIWELYSNRKFQEISYILKGYNLIGRLYAAEALLYASFQGYKIKSEDMIIIDLIEQSNYSFFMCSGCTVYPRSSTEHLRNIKEWLVKAKKEDIENFISYY